jgi:hypothetical protein
MKQLEINKIYKAMELLAGGLRAEEAYKQAGVSYSPMSKLFRGSSKLTTPSGLYRQIKNGEITFDEALEEVRLVRERWEQERLRKRSETAASKDERLREMIREIVQEELAAMTDSQYAIEDETVSSGGGDYDFAAL